MTNIDWESLDAARALSKYCYNQSWCKDCVFSSGDGKYCMFSINEPYSWKIPEDVKSENNGSTDKA